MHLSQKAFHEGNINKAVELAQDIPENHSASQLAGKQIKEWQSIWSQAESIYASAKAEVEDDSKNWYAALSKARQLQALENDYWANTRYYELVRHIQGAREEREKGKVERKSASQKSQVDNNDKITSEEKTEELAFLEKARALANSGKLDNMRSALVEASMVISEPHVQEARKLIAEIERKIAVTEDSSYLEEARKLASKNDEISLQMAVNEARLIAKDRPLYKQANQQIAIWEKKISQLSSKAVASVQTSNISLKAPSINSNSKKVSSRKVIKNKKTENQFKPAFDNYNTEEAIYPTIEKLEEMQVNYYSD
jgi:hypothetical protein